jgi:membrane-associated phospholipid phosphatase
MPRPAPEPAAVDIITRAGEDDRPPEKQASITLDEGQKVVWDDSWRPFGTADWIFTGVNVGLAVGGVVIPPNESRWQNRNGLDVAVRNTLRPNKLTDRLIARDASDVMLMLAINQLLVDTLVVTWWGHDADTVAWNMALINVEMVTFNTALNQLAGGLASRERPYRVECDMGDSDEQRRDCRGSKRFRSFYSGHTSTTFAAAGATCMHHAHLPLYGGGLADVVPCVLTMAMAGTTGALRLVADQHWASDVMVGAAMGTFSGLAVPYFLHYAWDDRPLALENDTISVNLLPLPTGGAITGAF